MHPGPLITKSYPKISWNLEAARLEVRNVVSLWHLDSATAQVPLKFQSDWKSLNANLASLRLHEILRYDARPLSE